MNSASGAGVNDTMADEAIARMLADPVQHLKVSLLLAWRGVFAEEGLGFLSDAPNQRLADVAGWNDWPRWRRAYGPPVRPSSISSASSP